MCRFSGVVGALFEGLTHSARPAEMPGRWVDFFKFKEFGLEVHHGDAGEGVRVKLGSPVFEKGFSRCADMEIG